MATYTPEQVVAFYERIRLPETHRHLPGQQATQAVLSSHDESYAFLSAIMRYTLAAVPFENLSLHYSAHQIVNISPAYLYQKVVAAKENRGGYCMENNTLLLTVLRSIGFTVYGAGARINESVSSDPTAKSRREYTYGGWAHMVILVRLPPGNSDPAGSEGLYLVDVGFGGGGPSQPMRLEHGVLVQNLPGEQGAEGQIVRLVKEKVAQTTVGNGPENMFWLYERKVKNTPGTAGPANDDELFRPFYCFTEMEFFPEDFGVMNLWPSTSKQSWFTQQVVCVAKVLSDDGSRIVGDTILWGKSFKRKRYGADEVSREIENEGQRTQMLEEYFGIKLNEVEKSGIQGMVSMLKS